MAAYRMFTKYMDTEQIEQFDYDLDPVAGAIRRKKKAIAQRKQIVGQLEGSS